MACDPEKTKAGGVPMSERASAEPVARFLAGFTTPEEIAAECCKRGIHGRPRSTHECPLAELIRSEFPAIRYVCVDPDTSSLRRPEDRMPYFSVGRFAECGSEDQADMPQPAADFAEAFDDGEYDDLLLPDLLGFDEEDEVCC